MQPLLIAAMLFAQAASGPALRIVVLEGEDAVNVTQQQTAVRPLIEVRDRNNLPVAGASVVFTIGGGQPAAFAGGLKTLTVTTSANGQAAGNGLSALRAGTVRIQVQASYLGQTATTTISQTNVATASAATQAGTASGGGGSGLKIAAIGLVGAAVAGGAVAVTQRGGDSADDDEAAQLPSIYSGSFSGQIVFTSTTTFAQPGATAMTCQSTRTVSGTLRLTIGPGNTASSADLDVTLQELSIGGSAACTPSGSERNTFNGITVIGGASSPSFQVSNASQNGSITSANLSFSGTLSGDVITGTFGYGTSTKATIQDNAVVQTSGSTSMSVSLRK